MSVKLDAILAAILFNINKSEKIKVKPDDAADEIELETTPVAIAREGDSVVCVFPMERVVKYATQPHDIKIMFQDGHVIVAVEPHVNRPTLYTANGQPKHELSPKICERITKISGGEIEPKNSLENA